MEYGSYDAARYLPSPEGALEQGTRTLEALAGHFDAAATSQRVLEIGCASGGFIRLLQQRGFAAAKGIDLDGELVRHGREKLGANVEVGEWLSYVSESRESFDVIVALDVFEHLSADKAGEVLEKTRQRLAPGGRLIMRMPNADCPFVLSTFCGDLTHRLLATPELIRHLLLKAGFDGGICFWETIPGRRYKRYLYLVMHRLLVRPLVSLLHFHFYGTRPGPITRNIYCCAERNPGAR